MHCRGIREMLLDVSHRSEHALFFAAPQRDAHGAIHLQFEAFRIRTTSIITALPAPLSVAPVPVCQESKWAPSMTISSFFVVPGISATMLWASAGVSGTSTCRLTCTRTGAFFSS